MLAKEAVKTGKDTRILIPSSDFNAEWKKLYWEKYSKWAEDSGKTKGKYYFENYFSSSKVPWFTGCGNLSRKSIVSINRIRSGHTSSNESLARFNIVASPTCSCGEADQSINHVILQCKLHEKERLVLLKNLVKIFSTLPVSVEMIINCKNSLSIISLGKFIDAINQRI